MRRIICLVLTFVFVISLCSCGDTKEQSEEIYTLETVTGEDGTVHSRYYLEDYSQRAVRKYFTEVVLASEYSTGGDTSLVQKWDKEIKYHISGEHLSTDETLVEEFFAVFEGEVGFPTVKKVDSEKDANLLLRFVSDSDFAEATAQTIGDNSAYGAATYYFDEKTNIITGGVVYYKTDMADVDRTSIILEELYNVMGASNDTTERRDSIIYKRSSDNNELSELDVVIMELLYRPEIKAGMDKETVEATLDTLYY